LGNNYDYIDIWEAEQDRILGRKPRKVPARSVPMEDFLENNPPPTRQHQEVSNPDQWPPAKPSEDEFEDEDFKPELNGDTLQAKRPPPARIVTREGDRCSGKVEYDPSKDPFAKYGDVRTETEKREDERKATRPVRGSRMSQEDRVTMLKKLEAERKAKSPPKGKAVSKKKGKTTRKKAPVKPKIAKNVKKPSAWSNL